MENNEKIQNITYSVGEGLTANNISRFSDECESLFNQENQFEEFVLDLGQTENIDSAGVTFVISLFKKIKAMEKSFKVTGANEEVQSLFVLMKLDKFFTMEN